MKVDYGNILEVIYYMFNNGTFRSVIAIEDRTFFIDIPTVNNTEGVVPILLTTQNMQFSIKIIEVYINQHRRIYINRYMGAIYKLFKLIVKNLSMFEHNLCQNPLTDFGLQMNTAPLLVTPKSSMSYESMIYFSNCKYNKTVLPKPLGESLTEDKCLISNHPLIYEFKSVNQPAIDSFNLLKNYYGFNLGYPIEVGDIIAANYVVLSMDNYGPYTVLSVIKDKKVLQDAPLDEIVDEHKIKYVVDHGAIDGAYYNLPKGHKGGYKRKRL